MKLRAKFAIVSVVVSAVPMAIAGYFAARIGQDAIRASIESQEQMLASQVADAVEDRLQNLVTTLRVEARVLDMTAGGRQLPGPEILEKFLQLVYHQNEAFSLVGLYDAAGQPLAPPAFQERPRENTALGRHEAITPSDAMEIPRRAPVQEAMTDDDGVGVSPVFLLGPDDVPHLVIGLRYQAVLDDEPLLIAACVSLRGIARYLQSFHADDRIVLLLDQESRIVTSSAPGRHKVLSPHHLPRSLEGTLPDSAFVTEYRTPAGRVIGGFAPARAFHVGVAAERPLQMALLPVKRMGLATIYWISISGLLAALVALWLGRRFSARIGDLAAAAGRVAQGRLDVQLSVQTRDELGDLAKAFNAMTTSLEAARSEILRQTREIRQWNRRLEQRVDDKTRELRQAQDMLLRSRALAAIGGLGAGVAHEINNPLAGVLGLTQLLLEEAPPDHPWRPMVSDIEQQALRIRSIVNNLLRLSQRQAGEDFGRVDLSAVVRDALELCSLRPEAEGPMVVHCRVPSPSPPIRGSAVQLQAAIVQIVKNALAAMGPSGTLTLETLMPADDLLALRISDTGQGIDPAHLPNIFDPFFTTKKRWDETGMGLSVVHKIMEDHGANIRVESELGRGTTFYLNFPIDRGARVLT